MTSPTFDDNTYWAEAGEGTEQAELVARRRDAVAGPAGRQLI
jgi:hypothetical protein